jgi:S1-C subfamily serine protease
MANGKRVKTIPELEKAHAGTAVGADFKLGIQRGEQMMIVTFRKADPKDLPQMKMKIVTSGSEGTEVLPAVGVILAERGKKVVIDKILPMETSAVKGRDVQQGDIITSLNGETVQSTKDFVARYDALDVGASVVWTLDRKGTTVSITFTKPKPVGRIMIRRDAQ